MDTGHICPQCGNCLETKDTPCKVCNELIEPSSNAPASVACNKSAFKALMLNLLLGFAGAHRFYVGKIGTGLIMLFTLGGFGLWVLVDLIMIVSNKFEDKHGHSLILAHDPSPLKKAVLIIGAVLAWLVLFVTSLLSLVLYLTSGLVDTMTKELQAIHDGDIKTAYSYTAKDFQMATPLEKFKKFIDQYPSLKDNQSAFYTERSISNNTGLLRGTLTSTKGANTPIVIRFIWENGGWKILGIDLLPTGAKESQDKQDNETSIKTYEDTDNKFTIQYPSDWNYETKGKGTIIFSGDKDSDAYYSTVNIQTVLTKKSGGQFNTVDELMGDLKKQITEGSSEGQIVEESDGVLPKNAHGIKGQTVIFTYKYQDQDYKQIQFVTLRKDDMAFYTWAYTSPAAQYDSYLPIAKTMFESWSIR